MHLIGVLLAAGRSRRMGRVKQLMPWPPGDGERPVVAAAFDAVAPACCAMIVVVGHEADQVLAALGDRMFDVVRVDPKAEMMNSVKAGLAAAQKMHATADVLLHPADHPEVNRETVERMIQESAVEPVQAVMPEFGGHGGHPVIIPAAMVESILAYSASGGLRQFWLDQPQLHRRIAVDDEGVLLDLDTQADYSSRNCP
jgi:molybdenum cofactor cytidylyltransferase